MTCFTDLKLVALAVMILLATALPGKDKDRVGEAESFFTDAPRIETRVLVG